MKAHARLNTCACIRELVLFGVIAIAIQSLRQYLSAANNSVMGDNRH